MQDALNPSAIRVAYLGPPASFSHQAAREAFPDPSAATLHPLPSFASIFSAVQGSAPQSDDKESPVHDDNTFDFALLPVENSTNGGVVQVLDLLIQCGLDPTSSLYTDVEIVAEHYLEVHHCLYVHKDALRRFQPEEEVLSLGDLLNRLSITTLYTHPQVWGQCNNFLAKYLPPPKVERIDVSSTSAAAQFVAKNSPLPTIAPALSSPASNSTAPTPDDTIGAICSSLAGSQSDLACLASNIEDEPGKNTTRFLIIRNRRRNNNTVSPASLPTTSQNSTESLFYKSLISFSISNDSHGALAAALAVFSAHAFNLTTITTRPSREENWHYVFFVECIEQRKNISLHEQQDEHELSQMLRDLAKVTERMCLLGNWADSRRNS